nr:scavenger receptor class F member 1 isoform X2 [Anolis sagrei ordinatus]
MGARGPRVPPRTLHGTQRLRPGGGLRPARSLPLPPRVLWGQLHGALPAPVVGPGVPGALPVLPAGRMRCAERGLRVWAGLVGAPVRAGLPLRPPRALPPGLGGLPVRRGVVGAPLPPALPLLPRGGPALPPRLGRLPLPAGLLGPRLRLPLPLPRLPLRTALRALPLPRGPARGRLRSALPGRHLRPALRSQVWPLQSGGPLLCGGREVRFLLVRFRVERDPLRGALPPGDTRGGVPPHLPPKLSPGRSLPPGDRRLPPLRGWPHRRQVPPSVSRQPFWGGLPGGLPLLCQRELPPSQWGLPLPRRFLGGQVSSSCNRSCPEGFGGPNCSSSCHPVSGHCAWGGHPQAALVAGILAPLLLLGSFFFLGCWCCRQTETPRAAPGEGSPLRRVKRPVRWAWPCLPLEGHKLPRVTVSHHEAQPFTPSFIEGPSAANAWPSDSSSWDSQEEEEEEEEERAQTAGASDGERSGDPLPPLGIPRTSSLAKAPRPTVSFAQGTRFGGPGPPLGKAPQEGPRPKEEEEEEEEAEGLTTIYVTVGRADTTGAGGPEKRDPGGEGGPKYENVPGWAGGSPEGPLYFPACNQ